MSETFYCFEDARLGQLLETLCPPLVGRWMSFDTLLERLAPECRIASKPSRLQKWQALGAFESEKAASTALATLEAMREALVLGEEDVEFAFSALVATPKNRDLRRLFLRYLDSELNQDWTARAWAALEKLKGLEVVSPFAGDVVFIRGRSTRYLFGELGRSFAYAQGVRETTVVESWEWTPPAQTESVRPASSRPALVLEGTGPQCLEQLGRLAVKLCRRKTRPEDLLLLFHGEPHELDLLRYFLSHHHLPLVVWEPEPLAASPSAPVSIPARLVQALRRDPNLALKDRLRLSSLILSDKLGRRQDTSWESYWAKLRGLNQLSGSEVEHLRRLLASVTAPSAGVQKAPAPQPRPGQLTLLPFQALPPLPGRRSLAYLGKSFLHPEREELCLHSTEIEALHQAGFPLPRLADERVRLSASLEAYVASGRERRFLLSPLPLAEPLPKVRIRRVPQLIPQRPKTNPIEVPWEGPPPDPDILPLPLKPFSATQLETYAQCPARYFFSNRLRLRKGSGTEDEYPLLFGQVVHTALENFFKHGARDATSPEEIETGLMETFAEAVRHQAPTLDPNHPFYVILRENFRRLIGEVPRLEKELEAICGRTSREHFEKDFSIKAGGLTLRGKIDRIDQTADGAMVVLDYKTGNVDFTPAHINQGSHFQALLYLLAAETLFDKPCAGILFYDLKKGELRRGVMLEKHVSKDAKKAITRGHTLSDDAFAELKSEGLRQLQGLAEQIEKGDFRPRPDPAVCDYCDFAALCRKGLGYV